jgi:RNA polymerase sigma-70 factor, ECF subfamily
MNITEPQIEQAVERVRSGNIDEYRAVVAAYHQRLRAALAGLCPPGVDSDEIAHLSFIQAYRDLGRYRSGTSFFAWLCAIARHQLLAEFKRRQRQSQNQASYLQALVSERLAALTEERTELSDLRLGLLQQCVARLKPEEQAVLDQRYGKGSTVGSIACALGRTASAVSVQLFALRQKLRQCVERKWREQMDANNKARA